MYIPAALPDHSGPRKVISTVFLDYLKSTGKYTGKFAASVVLPPVALILGASGILRSNLPVPLKLKVAMNLKMLSGEKLTWKIVKNLYTLNLAYFTHQVR